MVAGLRHNGTQFMHRICIMGIESCGMLISAVHTEEGEEKLSAHARSAYPGRREDGLIEALLRN